MSFLCYIIEKNGNFEYDGEAGKAEFEKFAIEEVKDLNMPSFYKNAINKAWKIYKNIKF